MSEQTLAGPSVDDADSIILGARLCSGSTELLLHVFSFLDASALVQAGLVCRAWWNVSNNESLWKRLCYRDWRLASRITGPRLHNLRLPRSHASETFHVGTDCSSYRSAWIAWYCDHGDLLDRFRACTGSSKALLLARAHVCWRTINQFVTEYDCNVNLRPPLRADDAMALVASHPQSHLPEDLLLLWSFHDGQNLPANCQGVFGYSQFYDHIDNFRFLSAERTLSLTAAAGGPIPFIAFGNGFIAYDGNNLRTTCARGSRSIVPAGTEHPLLTWVENYAAGLLARAYPVIDSGVFLFSSLTQSVAVTEGVEIAVSTRYVPSQSNATGSRNVFAYSITMRLLDTATFKRCKLTRRRWIFRSAEDGVQEVEGPGVVGYYPELRAGEEEPFRYESCTHGSIGTTGEGWFFFIRKQAQEHSGSSDSDSDNSQYDDDDDYEEFAVAIPKFTLTMPEFIH